MSAAHCRPRMPLAALLSADRINCSTRCCGEDASPGQHRRLELACRYINDVVMLESSGLDFTACNLFIGNVYLRDGPIRVLSDDTDRTYCRRGISSLR